ncbi:hypothetical protein [Kitasatospora purpeofusca]|uniref:nuclear transport factor 2 family protein n=1 Tax=Kitasatospora purpeofusca TaxID=67352 RepID=UPI00386F36EE|nr:hypothetical protein OIP63_37250 [Kitasatospora purpeofusca]
MTTHLAARIERFFDAADVEAANALCAPSYREHSALAGSDPQAGLGSLVAGLPPDFRYRCELVLQEGELLAMVGICEGLSDGLLSSIDLFRVHDGLLVEHWDVVGGLDDPPYGPPFLRSYEVPRAGARERNAERAIRLLGAEGTCVLYAERLCGRFGAHGYAFRMPPAGALRLERTVAEGDYVLLQSTSGSPGEPATRYDLFEFGHAGATRRWILSGSLLHAAPEVLPGTRVPVPSV